MYICIYAYIFNACMYYIAMKSKLVMLHKLYLLFVYIKGKSTTAKNILSTFGTSQHAFFARSSTASIVNHVSISTIPVGKL